MKTSESINISRDEWLAIGAISVFAILLIFLLPGTMNSQWFINLIPPLQYLTYNIGFIMLTIIIFGIPTSYILKRKIHIWTTIRSGLGSWLVFSFILDLWQPPFAFGTNGEYLITHLESLVGTSVDYMLGWFYIQVFPSVKNIIVIIPAVGKLSLLFILIYFITPIFAAFVAALLFKPKILIRLLGSKAV